jgi:hypothetical protein
MNSTNLESFVDNFDSSLSLFTELSEEEVENYRGGVLVDARIEVPLQNLTGLLPARVDNIPSPVDTISNPPVFPALPNLPGN